MESSLKAPQGYFSANFASVRFCLFAPPCRPPERVLTCRVRFDFSADSLAVPSRPIALRRTEKPTAAHPGQAGARDSDSGPPCQPPGNVGAFGELKLFAGRTKLLATDGALINEPPPPAKAPPPASPLSAPAASGPMAPAAPAGTPLAPDIELSGPNIPDNIDGAWPASTATLPHRGQSPTARARLPEDATELAAHRSPSHPQPSRSSQSPGSNRRPSDSWFSADLQPTWALLSAASAVLHPQPGPPDPGAIG